MHSQEYGSGLIIIILGISGNEYKLDVESRKLRALGSRRGPGL